MNDEPRPFFDPDYWKRLRAEADAAYKHLAREVYGSTADPRWPVESRKPSPTVVLTLDELMGGRQ